MFLWTEMNVQSDDGRSVNSVAFRIHDDRFHAVERDAPTTTAATPCEPTVCEKSLVDGPQDTGSRSSADGGTNRTDPIRLRLSSPALVPSPHPRTRDDPSRRRKGWPGPRDRGPIRGVMSHSQPRASRATAAAMPDATSGSSPIAPPMTNVASG